MRNLICCLKINVNVLNKIKSNTKNGIFDAFFSRDVETTFVNNSLPQYWSSYENKEANYHIIQ